MQKLPLIAIEVVIGFLVPVGWAVRELLILRREKRLDAQKALKALDAEPATGTAVTSQPRPGAQPKPHHPA